MTDETLPASNRLDPVTQEPVRPDGAGMYLHREGRRGYRTHMPAPRVLEPVAIAPWYCARRETITDALGFGDVRAGRIIEGDNLQGRGSRCGLHFAVTRSFCDDRRARSGSTKSA